MIVCKRLIIDGFSIHTLNEIIIKKCNTFKVFASVTNTLKVSGGFLIWI